jgi:hypothetical protein
MGPATQAATPTTAQIVDGTFDWAAWERQMAAMAAQLGRGNGASDEHTLYRDDHHPERR